MHEFEINLISK